MRSLIYDGSRWYSSTDWRYRSEGRVNAEDILKPGGMFLDKYENITEGFWSVIIPGEFL